MTELAWALVAPLNIFLFLVVPIWLVLHYRSKRRLDEGLDDSARTRLEQALQQSEQLAERVDTLERLLDQEVPEWRQR
ncbi:envelope stress response membrane protein PspB [Oceanimonas sp. NS1]|uniref:Envelope stress response membrane protein PspB n=1 Tax=Oceanimonas doudoroffii TaxID=84158 RepID=A0A233RHW6_9GAMM|nr:MULTISPECIES: envelope stress response membrane protein PspB [Oceanimonas]MCT7655489.1 envelope stress response membrane protein PspB [Oceanimonas sp. NS1]NHI00424.1 Phage shock protein B [Oceanimonas sp. MB9]OXY82986.1 envelope stress response membrane protein PspB [Oceanimonas doudoroffii]